MSRGRIIIIIAAVLSCNIALAQNTYSPYTVLGIGDISTLALANNAAMGGVGIAAPTSWHINNINPALLAYNKYTVFEFGLEGENRDIKNNIDTKEVGTGGFKYLSFAFPIMDDLWTANLGIMPYSSVNYNFSTTKNVEGTTTDAIISFEGTGGLNQVYFSNGFHVAKGLSVGAKMAYVFGLVEARTQTQLVGDGITDQLPTGAVEKTNYSDFTLGLGVSYDLSLSETDRLIFGMTYDVGNNISGTRTVRLEVTSLNGTFFQGDTLVDNESGSFHMPKELGLGFAWKKTNKMMLALDIKRSFWDENASFGVDREVYRNTWMMALGFEITPKYNDVNSYFKRIRYRLGLNYEQHPNVISGKSINDFGITFGWALPVKGVSSVNMAMKYGQRGEIVGSLVKEQYIKFVIGATINDRWFVRRKYN
jgi:long-subunit fatty acid transport protein